MKTWKFKYFLQEYTPYSLKYILVIKRFYMVFIKLWRNFIYEWQELSFYRKNIWFSSKELTYKKVIKLTFNECYNILEKLNIIFFTQIKKGCYRFIIFNEDIENLYPLLLDLIKLGYNIELELTKDKRIIFSKNRSTKSLKKYLYKFTLLRIYKIYQNSSGVEEFGSDISFELEYWYKNNGYYTTDSINNLQNKLSYNSLKLTTEVKVFNYTVQQINELFIYDKYLEKSSVSNIDLVYTWVDDSDKKWLQKKNKYKNLNKEELHSSSMSLNRFRNMNELKYSLRSIEKYFLGYRKIFIVVDGQKPNWLKESKELIIIEHKDIFPDISVLPVFNSHSIESVLHRIKDLSEHYLYINDDIIFGRSVDVSLFFPKKGTLSIFPSTSTYIPFGKVNKKILPVDTASINTRELLLRKEIGFSIYKFKHTPLPQLKSLLFELEEMFSKEILVTRTNRFRNPNDISMTSSLLYNFLYFKHIAIEKRIDYSYINLGLDNSIFSLRKITTALRNQRPDIFCVNDVDNDFSKNITEDFTNIMENFLPSLSRYEKSFIS